MEHRDNLLIVVDAGHGGWDNGASFEGRLEKDDNLRLALEVQKQFEIQCISVLMTRDSDVFVELPDRANIANQANADLFISLHRNSYIEQNKYTNGVENYIYLTAPAETTGRAAALVLQAVVDVGVQSDRGVSRGDYYVLRRTAMPAMLLEMGFIINEEDNRLFDEHLVDYAKAIVIGTLRYFNVPFKGALPIKVPAPPPYEESMYPLSAADPSTYRPTRQENGVTIAQKALNQYFNLGLDVDGVYDSKTRMAAVKALQMSINESKGLNLDVNGVLNPETIAAIPDYGRGDAGEGAALIQALLSIKGYNFGEIDGIYGSRTKTAVQMFQRDNYLEPGGIAEPNTVLKLLR